MIVTDLEYFLDGMLLKKIDLMIARCVQPNPKRDALLLNEGAESEGKTNSSIAEAYYVKCKTKREVHLFFGLQHLIDFAQKTENKIIIWDEPALDALSTDWYKNTNKDLMRLLMMARKKRHFFIFNLTKFHKFSEYIVVDRALGMVHMYSRDEKTPGRFIYVRKKNLEHLFLAYRSSKKRLYKRYCSFYGSFPNIMEKHFDKMGFFVEGKSNATYQDYERVKDKAIMSIGKKEDTKQDKANNKYLKQLNDFRANVGRLTFPILTQKEFNAKFGISKVTFKTWRNLNVRLLDPKFDGTVSDSLEGYEEDLHAETPVEAEG